MRIDITPEDITSGHRRDGSVCPTALALQRATGLRAKNVHVTEDNVLIYGDGMVPREVLLPPEVKAFIRAFDSKRPVTPLSFEIDF
jgi:hypothetical protein